MLKRLDWIKQCGFFENYRWDTTLPELARINVIYGPNETGKTSLARAFDGIRNPPDSEDHTHLPVTINDGSVRTTNGSDADFIDRFRASKYPKLQIEMLKRLLHRYGYPPHQQAVAVGLAMRQAGQFAANHCRES
jgi:energy-coupling factor transporter ATP-binding protein EcfA2